METNFTPVPDWFPWENAGASVAVADIDGDGRPGILLLMVDDPPGRNDGYYRVGRGLDDAGDMTGGWTAWQAVPDWFSVGNDAAGIAVADVNGNGTLDLIVYLIDAPDGPNQGYYRVGWSDDPASGAVTGGWGDWQQVPDWFSWLNAGGDITVADVDGDGRLDLVVLMVDAPDGQNAGYYRSGPLNPGWHGHGLAAVAGRPGLEVLGEPGCRYRRRRPRRRRHRRAGRLGGGQPAGAERCLLQRRLAAGWAWPAG